MVARGGRRAGANDGPQSVQAARALEHPTCWPLLYLTYSIPAPTPSPASATNANFHCPDGSGYRFIADAVLQLDGVNRQQAAGVAACLADWQAVELRRGALMRAQLQRLAGAAGLSAQVREVVEAALEEEEDE